VTFFIKMKKRSQLKFPKIGEDNMKKYLLMGMLVLIWSNQLFAEVPKYINYSGKIIDKQGNLISDDEYDMVFKIWDDPVSTDPSHLKWTENHDGSLTRVQTNRGAYYVILGEIIPLGTSLTAFDQVYYLEMSFKHKQDSTYETFSRQRLVASPYAIRAEYANQIADNAINTNKIVDQSINTSDIANGAITTQKIGANQVKLENMESNAALPVGSIIAWHKTIYSTLPSNWVQCNGGNVPVGVGSPIEGAVIPNLNGEGRFLRGGNTSGVLQSDELRSHTHSYVWRDGGPMHGQAGTAHNERSSNSVTGATGGSETRPINMSVVWIMKIK